jgi:hypothetical protein
LGRVEVVPPAELARRCPNGRWALINEPVGIGDRVVVLRRVARGEKMVGTICTVQMRARSIGGPVYATNESGERAIVDKWIALPDAAVAAPEPSGPVDRNGVLLAAGDKVVYHDEPTFGGSERPSMDGKVFVVESTYLSMVGDGNYLAQLADGPLRIYTQRLEKVIEPEKASGTEETEGKDPLGAFIELLKKAVDESLAADLDDAPKSRIISIFEIGSEADEKSYYVKLDDGWHEVDPSVVYRDGAAVIANLGKSETFEVLG